MTHDGVLVVAAEARELAGILRRCQNRRRLDWPLDGAWEVELGGTRLWLVAGGHGQRLAQRAVDWALRHISPATLISAGFCGALDPTLHPGDVLVATRVVRAEDGTAYEASPLQAKLPHAVGVVLSCDAVVREVEEKSRFWAAGWAVVEMEAAAVAAAAAAAGLPFAAVKVVVDAAWEPLRVDFNAARNGDGRIVPWRVLAGALRRPGTELPELWRFYRRCRPAAERLGEFLGACRF
ncbi:MAG: hypothetical protein RMK57_05495 [Bryobacterales bacterium]|nr:hypothetical protein [Bryobacteraceae bacterium]MDW8353968.1 hypothetical protein [Bryobacterales bacterium]